MKNIKILILILLLPFLAFSQDEDSVTDSTITMLEIGTVNLDEAIRFVSKDSIKTTVSEREEAVYYSILDSNYVDSVWIYEDVQYDSIAIKLDTISEVVTYQVREDISIDSLLIEKYQLKETEKLQEIAKLERAENRIADRKKPILKDLKKIRKVSRIIKNKGRKKAQRRLLNASESGNQVDEVEVLKKILLKRNYSSADDLRGDYKRSSAIKRVASELGLSTSGSMTTVANRIFTFINS